MTDEIALNIDIYEIALALQKLTIRFLIVGDQE